MKIRITSDQLRFRLDDTEVQELSEGKTLSLTVHVGAGSQTMNFEIVSDLDHKAVNAHHLEGSLSVTIPKLQAEAWATSDEEGIYTTLKTEIGTPLNIAIEKDYPCKH